MHDSNHEYDDNCKGCQPGMLDLQTNIPFPDNHPYIQAIQKAFKEQCTLTERRAWHRVVMQQSTNKTDLTIAKKVALIMNDELHKIVKSHQPGEN